MFKKWQDHIREGSFGIPVLVLLRNTRKFTGRSETLRCIAFRHGLSVIRFQPQARTIQNFRPPSSNAPWEVK